MSEENKTLEQLQEENNEMKEQIQLLKDSLKTKKDEIEELKEDLEYEKRENTNLEHENSLLIKIPDEEANREAYNDAVGNLISHLEKNPKDLIKLSGIRGRNSWIEVKEIDDVLDKQNVSPEEAFESAGHQDTINKLKATIEELKSENDIMKISLEEKKEVVPNSSDTVNSTFHTGFFSQISNVVKGIDLNLTIRNNNDDTMNVLIKPSSAKNSDGVSLPALNIKGTITELDNEFVSTITKPLGKATGIISDIDNYEKELEAKKEEAKKKATPNKSKAKPKVEKPKKEEKKVEVKKEEEESLF